MLEPDLKYTQCVHRLCRGNIKTVVIFKADGLVILVTALKTCGLLGLNVILLIFLQFKLVTMW